MKFFVVLALALAAVAVAVPINDDEFVVDVVEAAEEDLYPNNILVDVNEGADEPIDIPEGRITNGKTASPGQIPWQVGLSLGGGWCGGSLIGRNWVVTAAHCTQGASSATVYLGAVQRNNPKAKYTVGKANIHIHPNWNSQALHNDISLIKIPTVTLNSNINIVKLPPSKGASSYSGSKATISGWGKTSQNSGVASNLQWATSTVISNDACRKTFNVIGSHLCISTPGGVSTCNGDSGGPLVIQSDKRLAGITSFGAAAGCTKGYPAVFTRVSSFLPWIKSKTGISY